MDEHRLHVVLVHPEIPQNTGNIGRTCVAVGAKLHLVRPLGFRLDERRLRRAGLDYWQHLDVDVLEDWTACARQLERQRAWFFSAHAARDYREVEYRAGDYLVFGSETRGLDRELLTDQRPRTVNIPVRPPVRSLNLANAVAIALYEADRQIRLRQPRE